MGLMGHISRDGIVSLRQGPPRPDEVKRTSRLVSMRLADIWSGLLPPWTEDSKPLGVCLLSLPAGERSPGGDGSLSGLPPKSACPLGGRRSLTKAFTGTGYEKMKGKSRLESSIARFMPSMLRTSSDEWSHSQRRSFLNILAAQSWL